MKILQVKIFLQFFCSTTMRTFTKKKIQKRVQHMRKIRHHRKLMIKKKRKQSFSLYVCASSAIKIHFTLFGFAKINKINRILKGFNDAII